MFEFVAALNANNHADHADWRVPNLKELQSIVNYENFEPAVSAEFNTGCVPGCTVETCSCTAATFYWSSTARARLLFSLWRVHFVDGNVSGDDKDFERNQVRAVRGGL